MRLSTRAVERQQPRRMVRRRRRQGRDADVGQRREVSNSSPVPPQSRRRSWWDLPPGVALDATPNPGPPYPRDENRLVPKGFTVAATARKRVGPAWEERTTVVEFASLNEHFVSPSAHSPVAVAFVGATYYHSGVSRGSFACRSQWRPLRLFEFPARASRVSGTSTRLTEWRARKRSPGRARGKTSVWCAAC